MDDVVSNTKLTLNVVLDWPSLLSTEVTPLNRRLSAKIIIINLLHMTTMQRHASAIYDTVLLKVSS